jgi:hypothetical protein
MLNKQLQRDDKIFRGSASWAGRPGFDSPAGVEFYLSSIASLPARGAQPPIQWVPEALSPGLKRPGRVANHSPPSNAEVKNGGDTRTSNPPYVFMAES